MSSRVFKSFVLITALVFVPALGRSEGVLVPSSEKFEKAIAAFEKSDKESPPPQGAVLFTGSSSIRLWHSLSNDFPGVPVINRGFGGSQIVDLRVFAHRIVKPYQPGMIVVYSGGNDIHSGKSPEQVSEDFRAFARWVRQELPETRLAYISIAPNPKRWVEVRQVIQANRLIRQFIEKQDNMVFINVFPHMLGRNGLPKPEIFSSDRLHMNAQGYALWTKLLKPYLADFRKAPSKVRAR